MWTAIHPLVGVMGAGHGGCSEMKSTIEGLYSAGTPALSAETPMVTRLAGRRICIHSYSRMKSQCPGLVEDWWIAPVHEKEGYTAMPDTHMPPAPLPSRYRHIATYPSTRNQEQ